MRLTDPIKRLALRSILMLELRQRIRNGALKDDLIVTPDFEWYFAPADKCDYWEERGAVVLPLRTIYAQLLYLNSQSDPTTKATLRKWLDLTEEKLTIRFENIEEGN